MWPAPPPPPPPPQFSVNLMCPFSNHPYASFPNLIVFRLVNYWLALIYDFTVSGLLKIKLICPVSFHRVCPEILVSRPLTSRLTPFFAFFHCTEKIFPVTGKGEIFSLRNGHKIFTNTHLVWCLNSGFSSDYSPSQLQNLLIQKHDHSR